MQPPLLKDGLKRSNFDKLLKYEKNQGKMERSYLKNNNNNKKKKKRKEMKINKFALKSYISGTYFQYITSNIVPG